MVECNSHDREIRSELRKLVALLCDHGGWFADDVEIREEHGNLCVHSTTDRPTDELLMKLPANCLLPDEKFALGVSDDEMYLKRADGLNVAQLDFMQSVLRLYNATGKLASFRQTNPWLLGMSDTEFLEFLQRGRRYRPSYGSESAHQCDMERFMIQGFLDTRLLLFEPSKHEQVKVLAPVVDFLNHHPDGGTFMDETVPGQLAVRRSSRISGAGECSINYGPYDTFDMFLAYHFVEEHARFVRSVPVEVDLGAVGSMIVNSTSHAKKLQQLPPQLADLQFYWPRTSIAQSDRRISAAYLLIPQEKARFALRRVLAAMINALDGQLGRDQLMACVESAEAQIMRANVKFYEDFGLFLQNYLLNEQTTMIARAASGVVRVQLEKLRKYWKISRAIRCRE